MDEWTLEKDLKKGDRGINVRLIQEWLCLNGIYVVIDGDFGPATEYTVRKFQKRKKLLEDGIVGKQTFEKLVEPMSKVLEPIPANSKTLGKTVVAYARQHLRQHPREIGGENKGPWVRLYMDGKEGTYQLWCAGFACFILQQACATLGVPVPIKRCVSCDRLAEEAKRKGRFLSEADISDYKQVTSGSLFLTRQKENDWTHTGIVIKSRQDTLETIEGNTNDDGQREGYEVCRRIRNYIDKDFIII
jgi:hypothetical protein